MLKTQEEAAAFLIRAGFGGSFEDTESLVGTDQTDWIREQIRVPATTYLDKVLAVGTDRGTVLGNDPVAGVFWRSAFRGDDALRGRMVFALSQIFSVDHAKAGGWNAGAYYADRLSDHAFGNYRDLLEAITYSPAMGDWLTYVSNQKGNPRLGRTPDENYAREIMQLFSIGLVELNMDGTPKLDASGREIETYTNADVIGLAKVFTGLSFAGRWGRPRSDNSDRHEPLVAYPDRHSPLEKSFLGLTIPADTSAEASVSLALDHLVDHPNTPPFIARQLIQRFTASDPDPAYVERVARAFASGRYTAGNGAAFGAGRRGDLEATIAAILLDETVGKVTERSGKIREPALRFAHWGRAFSVSELNLGNELSLNDTRDPTRSLGQGPFRPPSVFGFYRPGYVAPNTESGDAGMTTPEFQSMNAGAVVGHMNFMYSFAIDRTANRSGQTPTFVPDYAALYEIADDAEALVDRLDLLMTGRRLSDAARTDIVAAVRAMPLDPNSRDRDAKDKVTVALSMIYGAPAFAVIH